MPDKRLPFLTLDPGFLLALQARRLQSRTSQTRPVGEHWSRRRGEGFTFADYKEYMIGDDVRFIDWSKSAQSGRWYVKQFETEIQTLTYILLDASRSMGVPDPDRKSRYAAEVALALAYVAMVRKDPVLCFVLGGERSSGLWFWQPCRSLQEFHKLAHSLAGPAAQPSGAVALPQAVAECLPHLSRKGLVLLISDFLFEPAEIFEPMMRLLQGQHDLAAIRIAGAGDMALSSKRQMLRVVDAETGGFADVYFDPKGYADRLRHHMNQIRRWCRHRNILFVTAQTDVPLRDFILGDLVARGLIR